MNFYNNLRKGFVLGIILVVFSASAEAFESNASLIKAGAKLTLSDCIQIALDNSPNIKRAAYNYRISKNDVSLSKTAFFPTIGVGTGYYFNGSYNRIRDTRSNYYSLNATLNQLIWNFGKTNSQIKMQKFKSIASLYTFDDVVLDTIFAVKTNYFGVLAFFDEGIRSKIDLVNAEVYLSDSKIAYLQAVKTYQNALVKLNNSMYVAHAPAYEIANTELFNYNNNEIPVNLDKISDKKDISTPPSGISDAVLSSRVEQLAILENYKFNPFKYSFEECVELAMKNRPDLKAYEATLDAMRQALKYIKREYLPDITGSVGYGFRDHVATNSINANIGLQTNINIAQEKFKIDNGKLQVQLAENDVELIKQNIYFDIQNSYINMIQLEKEIPLMAVKVRQTRENFELADGRYAVGLGDYIELQDAKQNYNTAQNTYVQTVYNYSVARANLERLIALPQEITITVED